MSWLRCEWPHCHPTCNCGHMSLHDNQTACPLNQAPSLYHMVAFVTCVACCPLFSTACKMLQQ